MSSKLSIFASQYGAVQCQICFPHVHGSADAAQFQVLFLYLCCSAVSYKVRLALYMYIGVQMQHNFRFPFYCLHFVYAYHFLLFLPCCAYIVRLCTI